MLTLAHTADHSAELADLFVDTAQYEGAIEWQDVKRRIMAAADMRGVSMRDVDALVGLDANSPDYYEKYHKLPKLKTAIAVATFLGVPAAWVLTGKGDGPEKTPAPQGGFRDATGSTVVQGNQAGTLIVHGGGSALSEQKKELLRIFDMLTLRNQTKLLHLAYEIEELNKAN